MPIRINLLAEQLAAEEMRRRDPVKRALYAGAGLVVLMLLWIATTFAKVKTVESNLQTQSARLNEVEDASKEVRKNHAEINDIQTRIAALDRYSQERFFWGSLLDSVQHLSADELRLTEIRGSHTYRENEGGRLFSTNMVIAAVEQPPFWKFWASAKASETPEAVVKAALNTITNRGVFLTNRVAYKIKTSITPGPKASVAKVEFTTLPHSVEQIKVELRGRDYGKRPGQAIDQFAQKLSEAAFFKEWLSPTDGYRFTERPPQARPDPLDPINPTALFVPFTIEARIKERIFTNE